MSCLYQLPGLDIKLKPCLTRQFHLGIEKQTFTLLEICNFPEIKSVADQKVTVQPSPPIEHVTTDKLVERATDTLEEIVPEPAIWATKRAGVPEDIVRLFSIPGYHDTGISKNCFSRIIEVPDIASLLSTAVAPATDDLILLKFPDGRGHRFP